MGIAGEVGRKPTVRDGASGGFVSGMALTAGKVGTPERRIPGGTGGWFLI
jgi:hypothetical protein